MNKTAQRRIEKKEVLTKINQMTDEINDTNRQRIPIKGKIAIFGDLHLSCVYQGSHKSYIDNCFDIMRQILEIVKDGDYKAVIFLGDIIGVRERIINNLQFLYFIIDFFTTLNSKEYTNHNVYSVVGNHDLGKDGYTTFTFLRNLGLVRNPKYIDILNGENKADTRVHFVNYGEEKRELEIKDSISNIVAGHAAYEVEGATNWYNHKDRVLLNKLENFEGIEMIISGHIHPGTLESIEGALPNGDITSLIFLGNPTRVTDRVNACQYMSLECRESQDGLSGDKWETVFQAHDFKLKPIEDDFYPKSIIYGEENELDPEDIRKKAVEDIINEIIANRLGSGNIFRQVDAVPDATQEAKDLAKKYLKEEFDGIEI